MKEDDRADSGSVTADMFRLVTKSSLCQEYQAAVLNEGANRIDEVGLEKTEDKYFEAFRDVLGAIREDLKNKNLDIL